ncbi:hypothetical protein C8Q79DRAFT_114146 [Trametes meyenii]|nr:hypothetical protein C8Q79DRAFT_114146 [Trametes meyenii]
MWVLFKKRRDIRRPTHDPMMWISLVMFTMATIHIGINYTRIIRAFVVFRNSAGGPAAYFNQLSEFTQIFGSTVYVAQTLIGDSVVLYRCYLVWGDPRVTTAPFVLLLGSTACGVGILYSFAKVVPEAEIFVDELQHWIVSFFSLTLATNIICTGLVALKSGAVYSAALMTLLILYKTGSWFQYVLLDAISPIVGLVFSMIIIRIGLGITAVNGSTEVAGSLGKERGKTSTLLPISFARSPGTGQTSTFATDGMNHLELQPVRTTHSGDGAVETKARNSQGL